MAWNSGRGTNLVWGTCVVMSYWALMSAHLHHPDECECVGACAQAHKRVQGQMSTPPGPSLPHTGIAVGGCPCRLHGPAAYGGLGRLGQWKPLLNMSPSAAAIACRLP